MGFIRLMVAMIFIMLFGYWDHKNVSLFLEYLKTLKRKEKEEPLPRWKLYNVQTVTPSWEGAGAASGPGVGGCWGRGGSQGWKRQGQGHPPALPSDLTSEETGLGRCPGRSRFRLFAQTVYGGCSLSSWCIKAVNSRKGREGV